MYMTMNGGQGEEGYMEWERRRNEGEGEWEAVAGRTMEVLMVMEVDYSFRGHSVGRRGKEKDGW